MKKYMPFFMAIIIGMIFGNIIFDSYETEAVMSSEGNIYMLQYGAYINREIMNESIKKLKKDTYITVYDNETYYVYLGISTIYENAFDIKKYYENQDIFLYIKDYYIGDSLLKDEINKLDSLIIHETDHNKIIDYVKQGLQIYQESLN